MESHFVFYHSALTVLFALILFNKAESCSIQCPENERPCGIYDNLCKGSYVGCALPEECHCNPDSTNVNGEVCEIKKKGASAADEASSFDSSGNRGKPPCGQPCESDGRDVHCPEDQRCRLFKDRCHMTCEPDIREPINHGKYLLVKLMDVDQLDNV